MRILSFVLLLSGLVAPAVPAQEVDSRPPTDSELIEQRLGIRFAVLSSKIRRRLIRTQTPYGFAVRTVRSGSPAARHGMRPGTVVLEVEGRPLRQVRDLARVLRGKRGGGTVTLRCSQRKIPRRLFDRKPWRDFTVRIALAAETPATGAASKRRRRKLY